MFLFQGNFVEMKVSFTFYVLIKWKMFYYREFLVDTKSTLKVHKTLTWFSARALNLVHILLRFISGKIFPASKQLSISKDAAVYGKMLKHIITPKATLKIVVYLVDWLIHP